MSDTSHTDSECFFCNGDGYVIAQPGDVEMSCPFCKGTGVGAPTLEAYQSDDEVSK